MPIRRFTSIRELFYFGILILLIQAVVFMKRSFNYYDDNDDANLMMSPVDFEDAVIPFNISKSYSNSSAKKDLPTPTFVRTEAPSSNHDDTAQTESMCPSLLHPLDDSSIIDASSSLSACLYWQDDYGRLVEWIAYHYQVANLRNLLIFVNPRTTIDPKPILDRWNTTTAFMNIVRWDDPNEFVNLQQLEKQTQKIKARQSKKDLWIHRQMQTEFYRHCTITLQKKHRNSSPLWTMYSDTDEYMVVQSKNLVGATRLMQEPGIAWKLIQMAHANGSSSTAVAAAEGEPKNGLELDCIGLGRRQYTSFESPHEHVVKDVPPFLDSYRFQTLRYRHAHKKGVIGKSIVDISKFDVSKQEISVHSLLKDCGHAWGR